MPKQEVADLGPAVVEDLRAPVAVLAQPGVGMLVEVRPVEVAQAVGIVGEVGRHPVEDHAVAVPVQVVDEVDEVVRRAVPRGRREVADRLISPAPVERMLGDRQELDVGEMGMVEMGDQLLGQLAIVEEPVALLSLPLPGPEMDLVDRHRLVECLPNAAMRDPILVTPGEVGDVPDDRGRLGANLRRESVGVGLLDQVAVVPALDLELVDLAVAEVRDEDLPDAGRAPVAHRVASAVPVIEVPDHAHPLGVGRPDREMDAAEALVHPEVSAEPLVVPIVGSLAEQVQIEVGQDRPQGIRVDELPRMPFMILHSQPVGETLGAIGEDRREEAVGVDAFHRDLFARLTPFQVDHPGHARLRKERPDHPGLRATGGRR